MTGYLLTPKVATMTDNHRKEYERVWRENNSSRVRENNKKWREANKDVLREKRKAYYEANKEVVLAKRKLDRKLNPSKYNNDKERKRKSDARRRIHSNFSPEVYQMALLLQNNRCAICDADLLLMSRHRVHADHCHKTGSPRGVLCGDCNMAIGLMKDDVTRLTSAIRYLKTPPLELV